MAERCLAANVKFLSTGSHPLFFAAKVHYAQFSRQAEKLIASSTYRSIINNQYFGTATKS
jgi:hypothetical protein